MHWEDLEGSGGEEGGRGGRDGEHMETHGCFISMYDKIHYNKKIIIIIRKKERKKESTGLSWSLQTGTWRLESTRRGTQGTQVSSETRVLYLQKQVFIYLHTKQ